MTRNARTDGDVIMTTLGAVGMSSGLGLVISGAVHENRRKLCVESHRGRVRAEMYGSLTPESGGAGVKLRF